MRLRYLLLLAPSVLPSIAHANVITNGNFSSTCGSGSFCSYGAPDTVDIPGWSVSTGSVDLITGYWQAPPLGGNSIDLDGMTVGGISQSFATVSGTAYSVSFYLSGNPDGNPATKTLGVTAGSASPTFTYTLSGSRTSMNWVLETFSFIANSALTTLSFNSLDPSSPGSFGPAIGNVDVEQLARQGDELPEPGSLALVALSVLALFGFGAIARRSTR